MCSLKGHTRVFQKDRAGSNETLPTKELFVSYFHLINL